MKRLAVTEESKGCQQMKNQFKPSALIHLSAVPTMVLTMNGLMG